MHHATRCMLMCRVPMQRLLHAGRQLCDGDVLASLEQLGTPPTLQLCFRLRGGGGDGGATGAESRSCYLEMYAEKKNDKVNPAEQEYAKWTRCHLSGQVLQLPVVVDELGNLYNKEALVHAMLHKQLPKEQAYISSLKHIVQLLLEPNTQSSSSSAKPATDGTSAGPSNEAQFCCPISAVPWNGRYKFTVFRKTGHAVRSWGLHGACDGAWECMGSACNCMGRFSQTFSPKPTALLPGCR